MRLPEGQPDSTGALRLIGRDLLPGQAEDAIARCLQERLLPRIRPPSPTRAAEPVAVDLDDDVPSGEVEVHLDPSGQAREPAVCLRSRKPVPAQKGKRRVLEVERAELPRGDDPVLPIREAREANIRWCLTLRAIIDGNVKHAARVTRGPAHVARGLRGKWS
jgi:hypothetical protein